MGLFIFKFLLGTGLISLIHTGYSAAEYLANIRATEQETTSLPSDIILQGLISLLVVMYSITKAAGEFKEIRATAQLENKTWDGIANRPSFYTFSHRGRIFNS